LTPLLGPGPRSLIDGADESRGEEATTAWVLLKSTFEVGQNLGAPKLGHSKPGSKNEAGLSRSVFRKMAKARLGFVEIVRVDVV